MAAKLSVEWINPFIEATEEILETVAMISPKRGQLALKKDSTVEYDVSGIIGITGEAIGSIALSFPKKTAIKVVSNFTGEEVLGIDNDTADAIGELTNMIAGRAKKIFSDKGVKLKISVPNVVIGKNHTIASPKGTPTIVIPFTSDEGEFAIQVSLVPNPSEE
ncbi:chemotaxis protein CheX [Hippea sp. KM1]|uniref:chemotaxis protein CheX n=1 Tax=Hippea sp. KM1 TaxID=944481 RepID=UPI00046D54A8|nr:chemotaxis protein CheX [Hippea sp. KM1]